MIPLQKPDFQVLKWSDNEGEGEALTLGAPLAKGHHLHSDLQRKYLTQNQRASKDEKSRGETTAERKEGGVSADPESEKEQNEGGYEVHGPEKEEDGYMLAEGNFEGEEGVGCKVDGAEKVDFEEDGYMLAGNPEGNSEEEECGYEVDGAEKVNFDNLKEGHNMT